MRCGLRQLLPALALTLTQRAVLTTRVCALPHRHLQRLDYNTREVTTTSDPMAWRCSALSNDALVDNLARAGIVQSQRVVHAMKATDRAAFMAPHVEPEVAYQDAPQLIGHQQTISAPHMVSGTCCPFICTRALTLLLLLL